MDMGGGAVFGLGGPDAGAHDRHEQLGTAGAIVRIADSGRRISTGTVRLWPGSSRSSVRSGGSSGPARPSCSSIGREAWAEVMSPDSARSVSAWEAWLVSTRRHDSVALTSVALSRSARSVTARPAGTSTGGGAMGAGAGTGPPEPGRGAAAPGSWRRGHGHGRRPEFRPRRGGDGARQRRGPPPARPARRPMATTQGCCRCWYRPEWRAPVRPRHWLRAQRLRRVQAVRSARQWLARLAKGAVAGGFGRRARLRAGRWCRGGAANRGGGAAGAGLGKRDRRGGGRRCRWDRRGWLDHRRLGRRAQRGQRGGWHCRAQRLGGRRRGCSRGRLRLGLRCTG
jgi:hypothetical protein